ncbi:50S ribosomal protein L27-like [Uloborus diversus]|uniref:50S ribosomal protein L27-like n=1 Tax=Uloborus diversus TaxID=327109 RepID=UPI00240A2865|nr:50S ribosomal protein L27-like [Uloborus diversus]
MNYSFAKDLIRAPFIQSSFLKYACPSLTCERFVSGKSQERKTRRKPPGVKRLDGDYVKKEETLVEQFHLHFLPGLNVRVGYKHNLKSMVYGRVMMTCEKVNPNLENPIAAKNFTNIAAPVLYRRYFHVIPFTQGKKFKLIDLV